MELLELADLLNVILARTEMNAQNAVKHLDMEN